jgi:hypothetical protein
MNDSKISDVKPSPGADGTLPGRDREFVRTRKLMLPL